MLDKVRCADILSCVDCSTGNIGRVMKTIVDVNARELLAIVADTVFRRPEHRGKTLARVEILLDALNADEAKRVVVRSVLFDTEKAAKEYNDGPAEDEAQKG